MEYYTKKEALTGRTRFEVHVASYMSHRWDCMQKCLKDSNKGCELEMSMMIADSSKAVQWPEPRAGKGINIPLVCALKPNTCTGSTPCKHNNVGDNTCFAKQDLFGTMVCPAGTTNTA